MFPAFAELLLFVLTLGSSFAVAQPTLPMPLEPGWVVREVGSGFFRIGVGLTYDPFSQDLFVTSREPETSNTAENRVYRITQAGATTVVYAEDISTFSFQFGYLSFHPTHRILYLNPGGNDQRTIRKITEFGGFIENVSAFPNTLSGMAIGPDGSLYTNSYEMHTDVARYNEADDSFTTAYANVGLGQFRGLSFDERSTAYLAGGDLRKVDVSSMVTVISPFGGIGSAFGDGSMFTTDGAAGHIWRVAPDGSGRTMFASGHAIATQLYFDTAGDRLFVTDEGTNSVWEYSYVPEPRSIAAVLFLVLSMIRRTLRTTTAT